MTAPIPLQGTTNPYTGAYQNQQFDIGITSAAPRGYANSGAFNALVSAPAAGVTASASTEIWKENPYDATRNPTGNPPDQHSSSFMTSTPLTNTYSRSAGS
jgi:hypothetical protein